MTYAIAPTLPGGLNIDKSTGVISGKPDVASPQTHYVVTASDGATQVSATVILAVVPTLAPSPQSRDVTVDTAISPTQVLTASGFTQPVTYTVVPALPAGVSMDPSSGVISGKTAHALAATDYVITATDGVFQATTTFSLRVSPTLTPETQPLKGTVNAALVPRAP